MSKIVRMLEFISLLSRPRGASRPEISRYCGISNRTVFRYLNDIEQAGMEVSFDEQSHRYKLNGGLFNYIDQESLNERLLVLVSLSTVLNRGHDTYTPELQQLVKRLSADLPITVDKLLSKTETNGLIDSTSEKSKSEITYLLLHCATLLDKKTRITCDDNGTSKTIELSGASLNFERGWHISGKSTDSDPVKVSLNRIKKVTVLNN